jgi:hypothetical protein
MAPVLLPKHPLVPGRPDSVPVSVLGFGCSPLGHAYGVSQAPQRTCGVHRHLTGLC